MNFQIALYLAQDGAANGAVYALLALSLVLLFSVTRVIFIPQGEFVSYGALTFASLQDGHTPGTVPLLFALIVTHAALDLVSGIRKQRLIAALRSCWRPLIVPFSVAVLALVGSQFALPMLLQALIAVALVAACGPLLYRQVFQPLADAPVLVLLIVSVALHFVMLGLGLYMFGPGGARTPPLIDATFVLAGVPVRSQTLIIVLVTMLLIAGLYYAGERTLYGKAMQAVAINRTGAKLMGISVPLSGRLSFFLAALIGGLSGVLIAPTTTILYDTGFLLGLKGFVGAILGGLASYPVAALGALFLGLLESYSSFFASSFKEVIVFGLMIPILLLRSIGHGRVEEEEATTFAAPAAGDVKTLQRQRRMNLAIAAALLLLVVSAPMFLSDYNLALLDYVGMAAIVVLGLVLLTGVAGLTSFAQAAYVGLSAYVSGYLASVHGVSPWLTLPVALAATFVLAIGGSAITVRLSGHYLPLATLAIAMIAYFLFGNLDVTGSQSGMTDIPGLDFAGFDIRGPGPFYVVIWSLLLLLLLGMRNLLDSRPGRALRALKQGVIMAETMGVDTRLMKTSSFVIACLLAGLSGWLYAHFQRFLNPSPFSLEGGTEYLFMAVIGGVGSIGGALVGSTLFVFSNQWLQEFLPRLLGAQGDFEIVVFGIAAIMILQFLPGGIWPAIARLLDLRPPGAQMVPLTTTPLPTRTKPVSGETVLSVRGVYKQFGAVVANRDINLDVSAGEILALIGPNGAGKSTLFDIISGVQPPSKGSVTFRNRATTSMRSLTRDGMARTYQHVRLLADMTVLDNVALGAHARGSIGLLRAALRLDRREERMLIAEAARQLERVGLASLAMREAGSLALGQQRVLEIARALCVDPSLLLLDEPAAGLRYREKQTLADLLRQLRAEGMAILLVEHDMEFVMTLADRIVVMQFGEKLAEGDPATIQRDPRVVEAYLGTAG